jgi:threonine synthase
MIATCVQSDEQVKQTIEQVFSKWEYVCDPHTAIAYAGLDRLEESDAPLAFLATAHPAKFKETVEPLVRAHIPLPTPLAQAVNKRRLVQRMAPDPKALKELLLQE